MAVEFEALRRELEAHRGRDLLTASVERFVFELEDVMAIFADQVVVLVTTIERVVERGLVRSAEVALMRELELNQELEGTINRGVPCARTTLANFNQELVDADVTVELEEEFYDQFTLSRGLEPFLGKGPMKGFEHWLLCQAVLHTMLHGFLQSDPTCGL